MNIIPLVLGHGLGGQAPGIHLAQCESYDVFETQGDHKRRMAERFHLVDFERLGVRILLQETGVAAEQALMIGDSSVDVLTGRNAGVWTCGVTHGFAPLTLDEVPLDVLIETPRELGELLR